MSGNDTGPRKINIQINAAEDGAMRIATVLNKGAGENDTKINPLKVFLGQGYINRFYPTDTRRAIKQLEKETGKKVLKLVPFRTRKLRRGLELRTRNDGVIHTDALETHVSEWVIMEDLSVWSRCRTVRLSHSDHDNATRAYALAGQMLHGRGFTRVSKVDTSKWETKYIPLEVISILAPKYAIELQSRKNEMRARREFESKLKGQEVRATKRSPAREIIETGRQEDTMVPTERYFKQLLDGVIADLADKPITDRNIDKEIRQYNAGIEG